MREDITKWVEALRSGEYKQCKGTLHNASTGGFCCLGVYAAVSGLSTPDYMAVSQDEDGYLDSEGPTETYESIRERLDGVVIDCGITMNDAGGSFTTIADMIEEYYRNA